MKKLVFIALAAIAFTTAIQAQDSTMHHKAKMHQAQKFDELNLTQDQKDKIKSMREENMTKMKAIKNDASLSEDQKKEKIKELHTEQRKSMDAILTDEQKAKMKQLHQGRMKNHASADSTMSK